MIVYRPYRNTDPPGLAAVWNEALTGRGAFPVRTPAPLERWLFSKIYFDPASITVAEETAADGTKTIEGFVLSSFGPSDEHDRQDFSQGIICAVLVRPVSRLKGIGKTLVGHAEEYLRGRGATRIVFGSQWPDNPHLFGLYGGSNSPGVLKSEAGAREFLASAGYQPGREVTVFQRKLELPLNVADGRFTQLRKKYDIELLKSAVVASWWQECIWSSLEPAEFRVIDKLTGVHAARAVAWELEGFGWRWNAPSAGILDLQVRPELMRQGIGKLLVTHIMRFLQDQYFGIVELQAHTTDLAMMGLCQSVGAEVVDTGAVYSKP